MKFHQLVFLIFFLSSTASYSQGSAYVSRRGFVFGTSVGGGIQFLDGGMSERLSVPNFKIGFMVNSKLGILLYAPGGIYKKHGEELAFEGIIPTAQYWISDELYMNAGIGLALETIPFYRVDYSQGFPEFHTGLGFTVSVGQEVIQWADNKTLDVQLRLLYGNVNFPDLSQKEHLAIDLLIGFNIY